MERTVFLLMILTLGSRVLGLGREMTLSYFYGASNISDAYLVSLTIPTVILGFIASGISTGYIPIYRQLELEDGGGQKTKHYTNQVMNLVIILCLILYPFGMIWTPQIVRIFASGFDLETLNLTVQFTRITLTGVFFTGMAHILLGYLQVNQRFLAAALVGIPFNLVTITFIVISSQAGVTFLAIGSVLAIASQALFLYILAYKQGFRYKARLDVKDKNLQHMVVLALPVIIGTSAEQINRLVDKTLASQVAVGGVSSLTFAYRIMSAVQGIFIASVLTVLYPHISKMAAEKNMEGMKKSITDSIIGISVFIFPAVIGVMVLAHPVVMFLFGRGAFDERAASLTSQALFFSIIAMAGSGIHDILARAFYSMQDTKTPMINATIALTLNIILNLILSRFMGIGGLALATSLSSMIAMILMWRSLHKKFGKLNFRGITIAFVKILTAAGLMGAVAGLSFYNLEDRMHTNLALIVTVVIAGSFYFVLIILMKIKEVELVLAPIKERLKKLMK